VVSDDQPEAREGQAGRPGVAERFVVPLKPGNAGGGKGPQFKTDAIRGEGPGDWATYKLRRGSETADGVARESRGLFSLGLRIEHTVPVFPSFVVFWISFAWSRAPFARLKEKLESLGYTVHE